MSSARLVEEEVRRVEAERGEELRAEVREEVAAYAVPPPVTASARPAPVDPESGLRALAPHQRSASAPGGLHRRTRAAAAGRRHERSDAGSGARCARARQRHAAHHQRPEPGRALGSPRPRCRPSTRALVEMGLGNAGRRDARRRGLMPRHGLLLAGHHPIDGRGGARPCSASRRPRHGQRLRGAARAFRHQDQRLPELLRAASRRRHRAHRALGQGGRRVRAPLLFHPGRR